MIYRLVVTSISTASDTMATNDSAAKPTDDEKGAVATDAAKASGNEEGFWDMLRRNHPIGRVATADEVAAFFAYMASDYATFFTGSVLMMDGGYTAQ